MTDFNAGMLVGAFLAMILWTIFAIIVIPERNCTNWQVPTFENKLSEPRCMIWERVLP